jgi:hypothetical protein
MTIPSRTKEQLIRQAETMLVRVYEQVNWCNLYGNVPNNYNSREYKKAVRECIKISRKYEDEPLAQTYEENFKKWKSK